MVNQISKKSLFIGPCEATCKGKPTLLKHEPHQLCHIYWSLWRQLCQKKCLLLIWKVLRIFVNILPADGKYSLLNRDNLRQRIHMQLFQEQKTFSQFAAAFLKARLNFEPFLKKHPSHSWCISQIMDSEKRG